MYSKTTIIGRLGSDPELRYTQAGKSVCNVNVATTDYYNGEEQTEWHKIVAWDKTAELIGKHLHKGSLALFEGKNQTRKWEDKDGNTRYTTEILVFLVKFLDPKPKSDYKGGGNAKHTDPGLDQGLSQEDESDYPF